MFLWRVLILLLVEVKLKTLSSMASSSNLSSIPLTIIELLGIYPIYTWSRPARNLGRVYAQNFGFLFSGSLLPKISYSLSCGCSFSELGPLHVLISKIIWDTFLLFIGPPQSWLEPVLRQNARDHMKLYFFSQSHLLSHWIQQLFEILNSFLSKNCYI